MNENFIILEMFQHEVSCCCPGQEHKHMIEFHQSDVWTIIDKQKYKDSIGWHFWMTVNKEFQFLIQVDDIEELCNEGRICSLLNLELKMMHLNFKVNEALDEHNEEAFTLFANELRNVQKIMDYGYFSLGIEV